MSKFIEDKVLEQDFKDIKMKVLQLENPIAYMFNKSVEDTQPFTCPGNPCTCGPNDIGRPDTEEEKKFFADLERRRAAEIVPSTRPSWDHEHNCALADGGECTCKV